MWTKKVLCVFSNLKKRREKKKWKWGSGHMGGKAFRGEIKAGRTEKWLLSSRHNNLSIRGTRIPQSDSWWSRRWGKDPRKLEREKKSRARVGGGYGVIWATWFPLDHRLFVGNGNSLWDTSLSMVPHKLLSCSKNHLNLEGLLRNIYTLHHPDSVTSSYSRGWVCLAPCSSLRAQRRWDPCYHRCLKWTSAKRVVWP